MPATAVATLLAQTSDEAELPFDPMLIGAVVAIGAVVSILVSVWALQKRARRMRELPAIAAHLGLRFSDVDPFDSTRVAFALFRAGDGRSVEHVMWNEASGARVFDYQYYVERRDDQGRIQRTWYPFTCALAQHNGRWPEVRLLRERVFDRALKRIGLRDIELESEEFNRTFVVQCDDARFAHDLLTPQMMEALLREGAPRANIETKGRFVLAWARKAKPAEFPGLLRTAEDFVANVPAVVRDLYGELPDHDVHLDPGLGLEWTSRETWRDPAWDVARGGSALGGVLGGAGGLGGPVGAPSPRPFSGTWDQEHLEARRRTLRAQQGLGDEPEVEYDLDGNPIDDEAEAPWGGDRPSAPPPGPLS